MRIAISKSFLAFVLGLPLLIGCSGAREVPLESEKLSVERDREKGLLHYIEGSLYDQKEEYAKAILEYQDAMRYDNDPAIYYAISKDYSMLGKHALAAQTGQQAVRLAPENRVYH